MKTIPVLINLDDEPEAEVITFRDMGGEIIERLMTPEAIVIEEAIAVVLEEKKSKKRGIFFLPREKEK